MSRGVNIAVGILALVGIAPWAIFLGGLAKLTDVVTGWEWSSAIKQSAIMLEWYLVSANFVYFILIAILGFASYLHRSHSFLIMFLSVNTALLIMRATDRIQGINLYQNWSVTASEALNILDLRSSDPLPYLRAIAAGEISTAAWNFLMAILIGIAGTFTPNVQKDQYGQPQQVITA